MKCLDKALHALIVAGAGWLPLIAGAADHPFMVQSPVNTTPPFNLTMPTKTEDGKTATAAVVKFVSVDCEAATGTQTIGSAQFTAIFNDQAGYFRIPFAPRQTFENGAEFTLAQTTLIYAAAGTALSFGLSAGESPCSVVVTGNLLTKDK